MAEKSYSAADSDSGRGQAEAGEHRGAQITRAAMGLAGTREVTIPS